MKLLKMKKSNKERVCLKISGTVQGVGFRPTVYRYAKEEKLSGFVCNTSEGIYIEIEGKKEKIEKFIEKIKKFPPSRAKIKEIEVFSIEIKNEKEFRIIESKEEKNRKVEISPDIATCSECVKEMFNPQDRRYLFPFINCTSCGPRFTIIKDIPYDREKTTMSKFKMCEKCKEEYENPESRRFHTQPNCCFSCGPSIKLLNSKGIEIEENIEAIKKVSELLEMGKIVAIKGIGGFHLSTITEKKVIIELRNRKKRPTKPFALMGRDINTIKKCCFVSKEEEKLLLSPQSPIVLLEKKNNFLPDEIAPSNKYLGFMLPYSPIHHLLFHFGKFDILIMTSANISEKHIIYDNEKVFSDLKDVADFFLIHNRDIYKGCDDSVLKYFSEIKKEIFIRRARGYVPSPIQVNFEIKKEVIASGGELKNTFALGKGRNVILSQHIGDIKDYENFLFFDDNLKHFKKIFEVNPEVIAFDMHPEYLISKYAREIASHHNLISVEVQHHHAHIASCMAENFLSDREVIGVSFDGTGYGEDGRIWGAEFLICNYRKYERFAHLQYIPLPGGEKAIEQPWRTAVSYLYHTFGPEFFNLDIDFLKEIEKHRIESLIEMMKTNINCPLASSMGRLFDAISSLCCICHKSNYEGEAAVMLEMKISQDKGSPYPFEVKNENGVKIIKFDGIIKGVVEDLKKKKGVENISIRFHLTVAEIIRKICRDIREKKGIREVVLSGGVFQNFFLLKKVYNSLKKDGFEVYTHNRVPPNDGGISLGQIAIASHLL